MANRNSVIITVKAKDEASKVVDKMKTNFRGAGVGAIALGNVISSAVVGGVNIALGAISSLASKMSEAFQDAVRYEQEFLSTASGFASALNIPIGEAQEKVFALGAELEKLSAKLPGSAADYSGFFRLVSDDLLRAQKSMDGANFSYDNFQKTAKDLIPRLTILAKNSGSTVEMASQAIVKALSGTASLAEIRRLDIFQKNPRFLNAMEDQLALMGGSLKEMTEGEILEVLQKASDAAVTDDFLAAAQNTVDAKLQAFLGAWFSPQTGVLSIFRDLNKELPGNQSVFTSAGQTIANLLYSMQSIGQIFSNLTGIEDPMIAIDNAIRGFNRSVVEPAAQILRAISRNSDPQKILKHLKGFGEFWLDRLISGTTEGVSNWLDILPGLINQGFKAIGDFDWNSLGEKIGKFAADIINNLVEFNKNLDYTQIFTGIWAVLKGIITGIKTALTNIDYGNLAAMLWNNMLEGAKALQIIVTEGLGMFAEYMGQELSWIGQKILEFGSWAVDAIWQALTEAWTNASNDLAGTLANLANPLGAILEGRLMEGFTEIGNHLGTIFDAIKDAAIRTVVGNIPVVGGILSNQLTSGPVGNSAGGNITPLLKAAIREKQQMPSGASLTVANSSEAILNQRQQLDLLRGISRPSQNTSLSIGNLTIQAGQTSDPEQLAKQTVRYLAREWEQFQRTVLTR